jgi:KDO2-lipid IV(A) lauroyltransferase
MARVLPSIQPGLSIATALRRHYALKQQFFVERQLFATARGRRFVARTYRNVEGREHLETARAAGRGVVIVSYHFDVCRMMYLALKELGYENYHHMIRETIHSGQAYGFIGRALVNKKTRDDAAGGVKIIYHQPGATFEIIAKLLQQGAIVGIAGDGMAGARFIEVPFLNGTLAFPTGPARLAARTGAPLVPAVCLLEGVFSHRVILYPPIYCQENSPASIEAAVRVYAGLLEEYVRRYPWSWWAWRRLRVREEPDGKIRFEVADESGEFDRRHGVRS